PAERVVIQPARHTAPQGGMPDAGPRQDLRHLCGVAEHVRQVADRHRAAELGRALPADLEVAHDRLAGAQEFVEQDVPRPDGQLSGPYELHDAVPVLGPDLQVVVDGGVLAIEGELERRVGFSACDDVVDHVGQPLTEHLKRLVPLTIPMRVWNQDDLRIVHVVTFSPYRSARARMICKLVAMSAMPWLIPARGRVPAVTMR